MQIHELNEFSGNPGNGDWYIVDSGMDTAKVNGGLLAYKTDVDILQAQVSQVITNNNGYKIETLWTGMAYTGDTTLSLSKAITNYDYLDFYAFISGIVQIYTVDATTGNLFVKGLNLTDDDSGKSVSLYEMKCVIDTQAVEIEFNHEWKWSGSSSASASKVSNPTACRLDKIVGRKCVVNQSDTEVLDIRVGADGTVYDSAGNAVRTQVSTLSGEIGNLGNLETTEKSNLVAAINEVKESGGGSGTGLTESIKAALLQIASKVAYIDDGGETYYNALYNALYPPADLVSISAVYTQSGPVYTTDSLDVLKPNLVVTALYSNGTTAVVTVYALSGTLTAGTSTITVSYGGKTTTFNVTVTEMPAAMLYSWDFTSSMVDSVQGLTANTTATQDSNGLSFSENSKYLELPSCYQRGRTYEIDVASIVRDGSGNYGRLFIIDGDSQTGSGGSGYIITGVNKGGDKFYIGGAWETDAIVPVSQDADGSFYSGTTVGFYVDDDGYVSVYKDGTLLGTSTFAIPTSHNGQNVYIGGSTNDFLKSSRYTGYRIHEGNAYE